MLQLGFKTNRGVVRSKNEDSFFVIPRHNFCIVADGVGGNNSGEVASRTAVSEIAEYVNGKDPGRLKEPDDIFRFISDAIDTANDKIYTMGTGDESLRGMATTVVMAYIRRGFAYIANLGDSRAYVFRNGVLSRITKDHTYVNELIDKGLITEEEAEVHKQKNVITRALGAEQTARPDFYRLRMYREDILLLCSDGLYGEVPPDRIADILADAGNMNDACDELVKEALLAGGRDNITVVCLKI